MQVEVVVLQMDEETKEKTGEGMDVVADVCVLVAVLLLLLPTVRFPYRSWNVLVRHASSNF